MKNKLTLIKRSTPKCFDCTKMEFTLNQVGIPFDVIDIAEDKDAIDKYGILSVPVMLIDTDAGQVRLNGFQPIAIIEELLED